MDFPIRYFCDYWIHAFAPTGSPHATFHFRASREQREVVEHNGETIVISYQKSRPYDSRLSFPVLPCSCSGRRLTLVSDLEGPLSAHLSTYRMHPLDVQKKCADILGFVEDKVVGGPVMGRGFDISVYLGFRSDLQLPVETAVEQYLEITPVEAPVEKYLPNLRVAEEDGQFDIQMWLHNLSLLSLMPCELKSRL